MGSRRPCLQKSRRKSFFGWDWMSNTDRMQSMALKMSCRLLVPVVVNGSRMNDTRTGRPSQAMKRRREKSSDDFEAAAAGASFEVTRQMVRIKAAAWKRISYEFCT